MLKVGVIGAGHLGRHHARIYSNLAGVELVGVADVREDRAREVTAEYGGVPVSDFHRLLGRLDAVSIAVPTTEHVSVGVSCLERGADVLVEKPIASDREGAEALIRVAEGHGRILQVGHVERFNPVIRAAYRVATDPQFFEIHRLSVFSMRSLDIDVVLDLMIHDIDIVLSLVQSPVTEIRAVGIPILSSRADIANVRIEFRNGCVANLTASRVSTEQVRKLRFFQPHDYVSVDYQRQQGYIMTLEKGRISREELSAESGEPLRAQLEAFVSSVSRREAPVVTGVDGLRALEVALRINEAIVAHGPLRPRGVMPSSNL